MGAESDRHSCSDFTSYGGLNECRESRKAPVRDLKWSGWWTVAGCAIELHLCSYIIGAIVLSGMTVFEWDEAKADSNLRKHGISFDDATEAFYDPFAIFEQDRIVDSEARWRVIGRVSRIAVLHVAHVVDNEGQDELIRIISARRADRRERRRYGQNC